jgi:hypothetical protein
MTSGKAGQDLQVYSFVQTRGSVPLLLIDSAREISRSGAVSGSPGDKREGEGC